MIRTSSVGINIRTAAYESLDIEGSATLWIDLRKKSLRRARAICKFDGMLGS